MVIFAEDLFFGYGLVGTLRVHFLLAPTGGIPCRKEDPPGKPANSPFKGSEQHDLSLIFNPIAGVLRFNPRRICLAHCL